MRWRAATIALLVSACAGRPASRPEPSERAPVHGRVHVRHDAIDVSSETATPAQPVELPSVSLEPRPAPPRGVRCVVYGRGVGLGAACGGVVGVTRSRSARRVEAVLELENAEFAFGFFSGRTKAWAHVEDASFVVEGFVETHTVPIALRRDVDVVRERIWLKESVAVHALGADDEGVAVRLADDEDVIEGFETIPARVPCEALRFDRDAFPAPATDPQGEVVYPTRDALALFAAPDSEQLVELGSERAPFFVRLAVLEKKAGWTRVGFETGSIRADVWARDADLAGVPSWGDRIGSSSCCGGRLARAVTLDRATVLETTAVVVGASPVGQPSGAVSIREGTIVERGARKDGFTEVRPNSWSAVAPPEGASFWVPTSRLQAGVVEAGVHMGGDRSQR